VGDHGEQGFLQVGDLASLLGGVGGLEAFGQ